MAVVDPGVGTARRGAIVHADARWLVGPDNGLFEVWARRSKEVAWWDIDWHPTRLSATFHGRDLFAPVAAQLALGGPPPGISVAVAERLQRAWPDDLDEIVYIDRFGNAMTGLRASVLPATVGLFCQGHIFPPARTFADVAEGQAFWYVNSIGLVELAANGCSVAQAFNIALGDRVELIETGSE
jgi:S-adenosylmethionine hydrolase